jgi:predicted RNA-binding Zn ribbon-like protein
MPDDQFTLLGDAVWLDFVNTARGRVDNPPDLLPDFNAWERWALTRKLNPGSDAADFSIIHRLRDQLETLAEALHAGLPAPGGAIAAMNELLSRHQGSQQLVRVSGRWRLQFAPARTITALEAIARSAAGTLSDQYTHVRRCAGSRCNLFFTDDSPTGSRRWCDAAVCGRDANVERRRGILR